MDSSPRPDGHLRGDRGGHGPDARGSCWSSSSTRSTFRFEALLWRTSPSPGHCSGQWPLSDGEGAAAGVSGARPRSSHWRCFSHQLASSPSSTRSASSVLTALWRFTGRISEADETHLHIGTHKTGTTALQRFLYRNNRGTNKIRFSLRDAAAYLGHANSIANALYVGDDRVVQTFLDKHVVSPASAEPTQFLFQQRTSMPGTFSLR